MRNLWRIYNRSTVSLADRSPAIIFNLLFRIVRFFVIALLVMSSFVIFSLPYAHYMEPPFTLVEPAELPEDFPLAIVITDRQGIAHCRAIWARQLGGVLQRYPQSSLILSAKSETLCQESLNNFEKQAYWSLQLPRERKSYWPYAAIKREETGGWIEVSYTTDDDLHNVSRYRLQGERITEAAQQRYSGPGLALRVIPYGFATTLLFWLLLKLGLRWHRRRKEAVEAPPPNPYD